MDLLDILYDFNCAHNWETILDNIESGVLDYNDAIAAELNPGDFIDELLPVYWRIVREHNTYRWGGARQLPSNSQYTVGIFLVGFSSIPIVLSIAEIQPRQEIYFLHSPETERKCDEITARITGMLAEPPPDFGHLIHTDDRTELINRVTNATRCEIANPADPVETFKQIKEVIDNVSGEYDRNTKIALELTGGKKTMISGGFTAGSIYSLSPKCDMFYLDSSEYNADRGAPKPGTEFLSRLDNPYDVYNVQSVVQAKELYKRHNYEAAERLWDRVQNKLYDHAKRYDFLVNERGEAGEYYGSSHCYYPWDTFDYKAAVKRKTYSVDRTTYSWGYDEQHVRHITHDRRIDVLDILAEVIDKSTLFATEYRVIHYAVDRYQNGMRRKQSHRLADAIVRFAQVIEIICNYRIYRLAQDNNFVNIVSGDPRNLPANKIWEFGRLIKLLFGDGDGGRVDIGDATYHALPEHRMQAGDYDRVDADQIINVIQPRNNFIHFNSPMEQEQAETDAENLRDLAYKFLEKFLGDYCSDYGGENNVSLNDLLELHKFRR